MDIFELSDKLLTQDDKDSIHEITGYSYQQLINDIEEYDIEFLQSIYSDEKIIMDVGLNKKGLHIYRTLLSRRIDQYRRRVYSQNHEKINEWEENGIIIVPNFLENDEYDKIKSKLNMNQNFHLDLSSNVEFQKLITMTAGAPSTIMTLGSETIEFDKIDPNEEQYHLHSDTFQPCIKVFYYINDIQENEGSFCFVKGSTRVENKNFLKWLYESSCKSLDDTSDDVYDILPYKLNSDTFDTWGKPVKCTFSPRLGRKLTDEQLNVKLNAMDLPNMTPVLGKGNTLVIADTSGFHRRERAKQGVVRTTLRSGQRFNPFMI